MCVIFSSFDQISKFSIAPFGPKKVQRAKDTNKTNEVYIGNHMFGNEGNFLLGED